MTGFTFRYTCTQQEIDEYASRCLSHFFGIGGNIPFPKFKKEYGMNVAYSKIALNERFYIAKQPYALCKRTIIADKCYDYPMIPPCNENCDLITGINLVSLSTRNIACLDIRHLLKMAIDSEGNIHLPTGAINLHLARLIDNAQPYITLREVLQELVSFVGNRHIFFKEEIVVGKIDPYLKRPLKKQILNCHFAEYVCHNNH